MASGSKFVVYAALAGNIAVAIAKFVAAALSGSSAMLTEAVHSSADMFNQLLLLIGNRRSETPPDASHPFGYGGEIYFWAFFVAVMVLLAGGATSIVQGLHELRDPRPIESVTLSLVVLALSAVFEAGSLVVGYRESRRLIARHPGDGRPISTWQFIRLSKDPNLYETLLEDAAALAGIGIAAIGVIGSAVLGWLWLDGAASIAIGLLLIADSIVIARATRSLIAGEGVTPALRTELEQALTDAGLDPATSDLRTLHLGPEKVLATCAVTADDTDVAGLLARLGRIDRGIRGVDERIGHVFFDLRPAGSPVQSPVQSIAGTDEPR